MQKFKCHVCGEIIDNQDLCPICGATSEHIEPYVDQDEN